jgi:hypothetical protein
VFGKLPSIYVDAHLDQLAGAVDCHPSSRTIVLNCFRSCSRDVDGKKVHWLSFKSAVHNRIDGGDGEARQSHAQSFLRLDKQEKVINARLHKR